MATVIWRMWLDYWFPRVPVRRLALFRIAITAFVLVDAALASSFMRRYGEVDDIFFAPIPLLEVLGSPSPSSSTLAVVQGAVVVALLAALVGVATRPALFVSAAGYTFWLAHYYSFGKIDHGRIVVVAALWLLSIAPSGRAYSVDALLRRARATTPDRAFPEADQGEDELAGWALRVTTVLLALLYVLSGIAKLQSAGLDWAQGGTLRVLLMRGDSALAEWLVSQPDLLVVAGYGTLALELGAFVLLFGGRWRLLLLATLGLHVGTFVLVDIEFFGFVIAYLAFFRLEDGASRVASLVRRRGRARGLLRLGYDGGCLLCVRTITVLSALDWAHRLVLEDSARGMSAMTVDDGQELTEGFYAFRRLSWALPVLWPTLLVTYLPPVAWLGERVYRRVAAARSTSGSCGVSCAVSGPSREHAELSVTAPAPAGSSDATT